MPIPRNAIVVKRNQAGYIMSVIATFPTREAAEEWAENANQWYGEDHPLTPLTVTTDVLASPPLFPVKALQ